MPMSTSFENRLLPILDEIVAHFGTPFHIYDEAGIRETGQNFINAFSRLNGFREYYAVKALPNPRILQIMQDFGFGFDCSSIAELMLSRQIGARGEDIVFSSNNTTAASVFDTTPARAEPETALSAIRWSRNTGWPTSRSRVHIRRPGPWGPADSGCTPCWYPMS
jgi:hypothetical protein